MIRPGQVLCSGAPVTGTAPLVTGVFFQWPLLIERGRHMLGHSQIRITLDIYSHVLPTMGLEAASKLDSVLAKKPVKKRKRAAAVA